MRSRSGHRAGGITGRVRGVCVPALELRPRREGPSGKVGMAANRTREIRPSGMRGGLRGNVDYGGTRILPRNRKSEVVMNLCLRLARAAILPGHPLWLRLGKRELGGLSLPAPHTMSLRGALSYCHSGRRPGIQKTQPFEITLDSAFRRNDGKGGYRGMGPSPTMGYRCSIE